MANEFFRKPVIGGDLNVWGRYNDALISDSIGNYSSYLFDSAGVLKLSQGLIGIDDGTNYGVADIDTETTIDISGISNSNWAQIELSVSGTSVTLTATDIAGATNQVVEPVNFTSSFNPEKSGYYINSDKRCIGIIWKNSSGNLKSIINSNSKSIGYYGNIIVDGSGANDEGETLYYMEIKSGYVRRDVQIKIGTWNLDGVSSVAVGWPFGGIPTRVRKPSVSIINDLENAIYDLSQMDNNADPSLLAGGIEFFVAAGIQIKRRTGGLFDNTSFDRIDMNRGYINFSLGE